jgi:type II secretory pathway pseudopilin PulG
VRAEEQIIGMTYLAMNRTAFVADNSRTREPCFTPLTPNSSPLTVYYSRLTPPASRLTPHGFTYVGLLIFIALIGIALAGTGMIWHTETLRAKESELLFVGHQYRGAIARYYESTPGVPKKYPRTIEDLLKDNRFPGAKRYLRKVYVDPMTGKADWGIVTSADGGVMGVYSLFERDALKTGNFSVADQEFEGKARYSDWKFTYVPPQTAQQEGNREPAPKP